jgi:energy-coupling factor transporter ATP-binding protein EcfA2
MSGWPLNLRPEGDEMAWSAAIQSALTAPAGATFRKCALQVNPYRYVVDNKTPTTFGDEASYNVALVAALVAEGVEVIAIADHFRVKESLGLWKAAQDAGIIVLPGFEAVAKDGVHFLCLFDPSKDADSIERAIGACGVHAGGKGAVGELDSVELLAKGKDWGAVFVAAHVSSEGGLLRTLKGGSRAAVWRHELLTACSLPGPVSAATDAHRNILKNVDPAHARPRPVAILNAQDVSSPADVAKAGSSCWIKVSEVTAQGMRQAFLDPESRVRLASDPVPDSHTEFLAIAWEGGFLDGVGFRFNENLNALIGGRGSGKSTVVESLRYALGLEPLGVEAKKAHLGIVRGVVRDGSKVSVLVRSHTPAPQDYVIERTVPNLPVVRARDGRVLSISPADVAPHTEVYGQHEIAELARSPEKLTLLLDRFTAPDHEAARTGSQLKSRLAKSRTQLVERGRRVDDARAKLSRLPALEERLRRYTEAGVETKLKERSLLVTEERMFGSASEALVPFGDVSQTIRAALPIDRAFIADAKIRDLPGKDFLAGVDPILSDLEKALHSTADSIDELLRNAETKIDALRLKWGARKQGVEEAFSKLLRELQATKIDAKDFLEIRQDIEELVPIRDGLPGLESDLADALAARRALLVDWEDSKTAAFRELDRAAGRVSKQLAGRVRVRVSYAGDREPLFDLLRTDVGGRLQETVDILSAVTDLSLTALTQSLRAGSADLAKTYGIPIAQADRLAAATPETLMKVEELELPPTTEIELNLGPDLSHASWQSLDDLSTGQKATAVLLLLLLESEAPLVVDQPEDDLDNRFITDGVVPKMREEKRRRQFVFATHNANIPVLGDAELIVGLEASGEAAHGRARVNPANIGSIDNTAVRELTEELLEGGRVAFETRRLKYGF